MKRFIGFTLIWCIVGFIGSAYVGDIPKCILWFLSTLANTLCLVIQIMIEKIEKKLK